MTEKLNQIKRKLSETVSETENALFYSYIDTILEIYEELGQMQRRELTSSLHNTIEGISNEAETELDHMRRKVNFDGAKARLIRKGANLSGDGLAEIISKNPEVHASARTIVTSIYLCEEGKRNPYPIRSTTMLTYLGWLKDKGYDPYKL